MPRYIVKPDVVRPLYYAVSRAVGGPSVLIVGLPLGHTIRDAPQTPAGRLARVEVILVRVLARAAESRDVGVRLHDVEEFEQL